MAPKTRTDPLTEALENLAARGPVARPYERRIEAACNEETAIVIERHAREHFRGSRSDATRDLIARGAASLAAERA